MPGPNNSQGPVRIGHYPLYNDVPSVYEGTYRIVYEHHNPPGGGAMEWALSTYMFPVQPLYGISEFFGPNMPPDPRSYGATNSYVPQIPTVGVPPQMTGFWKSFGLLPGNVGDMPR